MSVSLQTHSHADNITVGELEVPTTKVSQVLQSVSKWLYDKDINKTALPSTATVNNFEDIAQLLGNIN